MAASVVGKRGWPALLVPAMKLRKPLEQGDRLVLTVHVLRTLAMVGVVERVQVRRRRAKAVR